MMEEWGQKALFDAIETNNIQNLQKLLDQGVDVDAHNYLDVASLRMAASGSDPAVVKLLLDCKATANLRSGFRRRTALHAAADAGRLESVRYLVEAKACVNVRDIEGQTALMEAAYSGHEDVTGYLLEARANARMRDKYANGALETAVQEKHVKIAQMILEEHSRMITRLSRRDLSAISMLHQEVWWAIGTVTFPSIEDLLAAGDPFGSSSP